ncbi:MAG: class I SAM-dependent methyltransferase [Planctomycetota bacterium]|jgi:tocopherol O-methyltransferase
MIEFPSVEKKVIRNHYDVTTPFYRLFWGPHIHHGYWDGNESSQRAQIQLTEKLVQLANIAKGATVYDIGCGMGGSSVWLAQHLGCQVTGVTLSPVQRFYAAWGATLKRVQPAPRFLRADAEKLELPVGSADVVWSIECTEHLFDKPAFFRKAATWLKPGGRFAICAWLTGEPPMNNVQTEQARKVCEGMFCPSLGAQSDYVQWFEEAGLTMVDTGLWTRQVERTWEICLERVQRTGVRHLAKILGSNHVLFLDHFQAILDAYRSGAMEYGYFVAEKRAS